MVINSGESIILGVTELKPTSKGKPESKPQSLHAQEALTTSFHPPSPSLPPFGEMRPKQFSPVRKLPPPDARSRGVGGVIVAKGPGQFSCHTQTEEYFWRNADATALPRFTLSTPPRKKLLVSHAGPAREPEPARIAAPWRPLLVGLRGETRR